PGGRLVSSTRPVKSLAGTQCGPLMRWASPRSDVRHSTIMRDGRPARDQTIAAPGITSPAIAGDGISGRPARRNAGEPRSPASSRRVMRLGIEHVISHSSLRNNERNMHVYMTAGPTPTSPSRVMSLRDLLDPSGISGSMWDLWSLTFHLTES